MFATPSVTRAIRHAFGRGRPSGGTVLLYHRVADLVADPQCLAVSPDHFAAHLDVIATRGVPMTLTAMRQQAREGVLPAGAVAVTFDDGYADNLEIAMPLLARAGVPATVFVSTAAMQRSREFWWDEIERILLGPVPLPAQLRVALAAGDVTWDLTGAAARTPDECAREAGWNVLSGARPTPRHRAYVELCARLRPLTAHARDRVLDALSVVAQTPREPRTTHRPLSAADIAALNKAGIDVGSHTESHPSLAALSPDDQHGEIHRAREQLETIVDAPVTSFAYPFGGRADVSPETVAAARRAGITVACSTMPGVVTATTDPLRVPRMTVRNWTGTAFASRWEQWTGVTSGVAR